MCHGLRHSICMRTVRSKLLFGFGTFDFSCLVLAEIESINQFKPVQQSRQQALSHSRSKQRTDQRVLVLTLKFLALKKLVFPL